jgi:hypothetical protein
MPQRSIDDSEISGRLARPLELGGFHRRPYFGPVQGIVETEITRSVALFGQCAFKQRQMALGRPIAQHRNLQPVERIQQTAAFSESSRTRFGSANPLQGQQH